MSLSTLNTKKGEAGFTLIELSIVLVIIGLIVGGVLTGQDMIKAAQIRAEVTQLERYNTAVNTFRGKYNGLPGDLANPTTFFSAITNASSSQAGAGNGDGQVQSLSAAATQCAQNNCMAGENLIFWYELNQAAYIPDNTSGYTNMTNVTQAMGPTIIPVGKLTGNVGVNSANGLNYWVLASIGGTAAAGLPTYAAGLTPLQAYQMDTKIDDGQPDTGILVSIPLSGATGGTPGTASNLTAAAAVTATTCGTNDTHVYVLTTLNGNNNANLTVCNISVRTSF